MSYTLSSTWIRYILCLDEVIMGGLVLETNQADVMAELDEQNQSYKI